MKKQASKKKVSAKVGRPKKKVVAPSHKNGAPKKRTMAVGKKATAMVTTTKHAGGRPSLLTQAKLTAIAGHIEAGNFAVTACILENINDDTFYEWIARGKRGAQNEKRTIYRQFSGTIKKASAVAESKNVKVALAGELGWQANMTWLERRFPDRWGQHSKLNMEEARDFVHRVMGALAVHIADRSVLEKIVNEVRGVKVERRAITHTN